MPAKGNKMIPDVHLRKDWARRVKTWFNQPARKERRHNNRVKKAAAVFPRPVGLLRPVIRCSSIKYNTKVRLGRGFTLEELREAGINRHQALSIGISVDHRRVNRNDSSLRANVQRLKEYKSRLILFPIKAARPNKKDSPKEELEKATQSKDKVVMPVRQQVPKMETVSKADLETLRKKNVFVTLRTTRADARYIGIRAKRQKEKEANAALNAAKAAKKGS